MKYYLHDTNSFQDEKITELFIQYGYEGLGLFYTILEKIAMQEKPIKTVVLKKQLSVGKKLDKVWSFLEEIELIYSNNGETFNENILKFSEKYQIKKEKTKERVAKWRDNQLVTEDVTRYESVSNTPKDKISKVKESKVKQLQQKEESVADVVDGFSFSKNKINAIRQEVRGAVMLREQTCMSLRITVDFYANLVEGFFDEQIALAEAGDTINYEGLRSHFKNWTRKQVALGKDSRFHSAFKPVAVNTANSNGRYGPPQAVVNMLKTSIPD